MIIMFWWLNDLIINSLTQNICLPQKTNAVNKLIRIAGSKIKKCLNEYKKQFLMLVYLILFFSGFELY